MPVVIHAPCDLPHGFTGPPGQGSTCSRNSLSHTSRSGDRSSQLDSNARRRCLQRVQTAGRTLRAAVVRLHWQHRSQIDSNSPRSTPAFLRHQ